MSRAVTEWVVSCADGRGKLHHLTVEARTEQEARRQISQRGFLVYTVRPKTSARLRRSFFGRRGINPERFLIFNQQFLTLVRAGLPILRSLELLGERFSDARLARYVRAVAEEIRTGASLSEAFERQGVFSPIYISSLLAGEKSGSLADVLERFITYQRLSLAVRRKLLLSLLYPSLLVVLVIGLIVFLVTYVVPNFAQLYASMAAQLPRPTQILIAVGTTARNYILAAVAALVLAGLGFHLWAQSERARERIDRWKLRTPILGEIWIKYQTAQISRILSTLLSGGIPLVPALETTAGSQASVLLRKALEQVRKAVREGQGLARSLAQTGLFPAIAVDMIEVGESTGALASMLNSVAEFFEEDVQTRLQAVLSLIEPALMIFMGVFVAFVLISLYLPIFSLADTLR